MLALLLSALLSLLPSAKADTLYPEGWKPIPIGSFGGLDLLNDSSMIGGDAQVAVNVLTDNSFLEKRPGSTLLATILPGYSVQYVNDWYSPSGNLYLIAQSSQTIYQTNFSGSPVALSTVAVGYNLTTTPAFSKLEFADGFRPLWYWNGTSTGTVTDGNGNNAPICMEIAYKDSRIWCANLPNGFSIAGNTENGGGSSTVLISSAGGDGYWSVPQDVASVDNAPNRFDFNPDDGDQITCMAPTPWGMFIAKRNSSYLVIGNGNLTYNPRILDPKIGCVDNRSVQMVYGTLEWLAVDGVYGWNGAGAPQLLTRKLDPLMQKVRESTFSQGQWATQLQGDWQSGTTTPGTANVPPASWDTNSLPGSIFPSSGTLYDDNTSPSLQNCSTHLNPDNGLPWSCGVGFASDTLVNIDTMTAPLSVGYAQLVSSPSGILITSSTFLNVPNAGNLSAAQLSAIKPGWVLLEGNMEGVTGTGIVGYIPPGQGTYRNTIYSVPSSTLSQQTDGMMVGTWSMSMNVSDSETSGQCAYGGAGECTELDFINTTGPTSGSPTLGYGLRIDETSGSSYALTLNKYIASARTVLGTYNFTWTGQNVNFGASRTAGGEFTVYYGTGGLTSNEFPVFSAKDVTASISSNVASAITLYGEGVTNQGFWNILATGFDFRGYSNSGAIDSRIVDTGSETPVAGALSSSYTLTSDGATSLTFKVRSSTSPNNDMWGSWNTVANAAVPTGMNNRYWQSEEDFATTVASETPVLQSLELKAITTGYYYSKVNFIGDLITSWRQFGVTVTDPGNYQYAVREATYAFPADNPNITWNAQSPNQDVNLSVSTPTYAQFRLDSTGITNADKAEIITAAFLRWDQGADLPVASDTLERRYMLCVTISTTSSAPDTCLIRQKNGEWVEWSNGGTIGAMGLYNYQMVAADGGTSSKAWTVMQDNPLPPYSDDGAAINAQWVTADFTDQLPFNVKTYYGSLIDAQAVQGSSVTFGYAVDKSSSFITTTFSTDNGSPTDSSLFVSGDQYGAMSKWIQPSYGYDQGKFIRLEFTDDTPANYFRINQAMIFVKDNPWYPPP